MTQPPFILAICCAVLEDEVRHFAAGLPQVRDIVILPQGLHNEPQRLRRELQAAVDGAEARPEITAIALAYGSCGRGVEGIRHDRCPLVIARAHDCVTLLLGDKDRYAAYLRDHPGTYWYSPGWIKCAVAPGPDRTETLRREYTAKFGPEEAAYLMEVEQQWMANYNRATYVGLGLGETDKDVAYTRHCADCLKWNFDRVRGDPALLTDLLAGRWDEGRFLVVPPGHAIQLTADNAVLRAVPAAPAP